jgi:hypothetical protein
LQVKGQTACGGLGAARAVTLIRATTPAVSSITTDLGNNYYCADDYGTFTAASATVTSIQRPIATYRWTLPSNTTMLSANSDSSVVSLIFTGSFTGGSLQVRGVNACGTLGTAKAITISTALCRGGNTNIPTTKIANQQSPLFTLVYPNPNQGRFTLEATTGNLFSEKVDVSIINANGKLVDKFSTQSVAGKIKTQIQSTKLSNGLYWVKFETASHQKGSTRIVVQQ